MARVVHLYGGAARARVPARFIDLSDVAPVPDHQEVFFDPALEESVHFELVELDDGDDDRDVDVARRLFHDWCDASCGEHARVSAVTREGGDGGARAWTRAGGVMRARRDGGRVRDVDVHLGMMDVVEVKTRVLIWHCRPYAYDGGRVAPDGTEAAPSAFADDASDDAVVPASDVLRECVESFSIVDWNLFA